MLAPCSLTMQICTLRGSCNDETKRSVSRPAVPLPMAIASIA